MNTTLRCHHDRNRSDDPVGRAYGRFLELPNESWSIIG